MGYTKLRSFKEKTVLGNSLSDALFYNDQNIKSALATIGVLFDINDKREEKIINQIDDKLSNENFKVVSENTNSDQRLFFSEKL